ncbi:MAG: sortase [Candidatus Levybacteria bacterium]|nr:sortase [Candidatus Levybacteria bacterium]
MDLEIFPAKIVNNRWEITAQGVSYLSSSPLPGEKGNSVLYGHNWTNILGNLIKIKPGEEIVIVSNRNNKRTFVVEHISVVDPENTQILANTSDRRITLYTCSGFLDSKRFVVTALLKS